MQMNRMIVARSLYFILHNAGVGTYEITYNRKLTKSEGIEIEKGPVQTPDQIFRI
jgi:hypothetical protein